MYIVPMDQYKIWVQQDFRTPKAPSIPQQYDVSNCW